MTSAIQADDSFHGVFVRASANSEVRHTLDRLMPSSLAGHTSVLQHTDAKFPPRVHGEGTSTSAKDAIAVVVQLSPPGAHASGRR